MANFFDNKARAAAITSAGNNAATSSKNAPDKELPHMLFYGPPGTGKTSTILALAKELYGPEMFKSRVLELNASDERGISIIREKVKDFARMQLSNPPPNYKERFPCPPYKIIILDEADSMTQDAQSALRRTMETYSKITRFCLICNYVTRIIDPLASRCSKFRFKMLDQHNAKKRLEEIAKNENVRLEGGVVDTLISCSEGDLRKAITFLQSAAKLTGAVSTVQTKTNGHSAKRRRMEEDSEEDAMDIDGVSSAVISVGSIEEIAGIIPNNVVEGLLHAIQPQQKPAPYEAIERRVTDLVADGWSAMQVLSQLYQRAVYDDTISNKQKSRIVIQFSEVDKRLADGADEHLAILDLSLQMSKTLSES
ncbi:uncharacterized protein KY384_008350 [Bacidia gigantensis]|uniref:uncharacterized protein n=1 Tax=Bacidia gigantensis TaxID=2732470 RepID=UPI001D03C3E4|nr:uncharacterized protein KY384_008350 [Bacidia gigantensis]KAG8526921.1 hypothetical protein KY384_008350 [Bacidia gigantensis]